MTREEAKAKIYCEHNYTVREENEELIDKIYDDFEARTCDSCKHKYIFDSMRTDCRHNDSPIDFLDLDCFPDFGCNKWEQK